MVVDNSNFVIYERWSEPSYVHIGANSIVELPSILATVNPFPAGYSVSSVKFLLRWPYMTTISDGAVNYSNESLLVSKTYSGSNAYAMNLFSNMFGFDRGVNPIYFANYESHNFIDTALVNDVTSKYCFKTENSIMGGIQDCWFEGLQTGLKYYLYRTDVYSSILQSIEGLVADTYDNTEAWSVDVYSLVETNHSMLLNVVSMVNTNETYLGTVMGYTDNVESMVETNEQLLNDFALSSDASALLTLKDWHWDTVSMLESQEDYVWNPLHSHLTTIKTQTTNTYSMLDTVEDDVWNPIHSHLETIKATGQTTLSHVHTTISMADTAEHWAWNYTFSMLETQENYHWDVQSFQQTSHSMLNTEEDYDHIMISHLDTCQSFLMWHMVGLGTGAYYYDENGYYRNNEATGTQILWATGETGVLTDESDGDPIADAEITAFRVTGSFATGIRETGNRGIADQTKTDTAGKYHGYLDPGIYDFHAYKDGFIDEYKRRELTTV
jgi:hypothetical protein